MRASVIKGNTIERFNLQALIPLVILTALMMGCVGASQYDRIPSIEDFSPRSTKAGGPAFTLTVTGAHFTDNSVILWNGVARPTIATSNVELRALIPAADIAVAGTAQLSVRYPKVDSLAVPSVNAPAGPTSEPVGPSFAQSAPKSFSITASTASSLNIMTDSLPSSRISQRYNVTLVASGGHLPYSWSLATSPGPLPPGLTLATATGAISGTPSVANQYNFAIKVTDTSGQSATRALSMSVSAAINSSLNITTTSLSAGQVSQPYNVVLGAAGGTPPYTWGLSTSSGSLPPGLTLGTTTGEISGAPAAVSQYTFTVRVTDSSSPQQTATRTLSMTTLGVSLDQYGGREDINCTTATGYFHVEKLGNQWWFCTPLGHAFFMEGAYVVDQALDAQYAAKVTSKYGGVVNWQVPTLNRILSWGFNALANYANVGIVPTATDPSYPLDSNGLHSIPVKLPYIVLARPGAYSMRNPLIVLSDSSQAKLLPVGQEVKNTAAGWSPFYNGFVPGPGSPDFYDPNMTVWLDAFLAQAGGEIAGLKNSPYANYAIGMGMDDGDEMYGFGAGPDFTTVPGGHVNAHLGWLAATMAPTQTVSNLYPTVYADTTVYTKKAWRDYLVGKYGTIASLNAAWTSNYTTFGSTGTVKTGESIGTGNGSRLTFAHTLSNLTPSALSVQIFVSGVPVAGDLINGTIYGPAGTTCLCSGTINYTTGALSITFTTAPSNGAPITVNYIQNGWAIGTGLMDEDARVSHQAWLGIDYLLNSDTNPNVLADMDGFLFQLADTYLKMGKTEIHKTFPNIILLGPDSLGSWGAPPRRQVLQAAALEVDVLTSPGHLAEVQFQPKMDFVNQWFGDKPLATGSYLRANADSPWAAFSTHVDLSTQTSRGQSYASSLSSLRSLQYSATGSQPIIGVSWWQYTDNRAEKANWGLVTLLDNAYDGQEDVSGIVKCSAPLQSYSCGGEAANYGDVITSVRTANLFWLSH
jgi:hypothetical protein